MSWENSPFAYPGHYVVNGECLACGRKPDDLEFYGSLSAARSIAQWTSLQEVLEEYYKE